MSNTRNTMRTEPAVLETQQPETQKTSAKKGHSSARWLAGILEGSFLVRDRVVKLLPFLLYLTFLGMLYIFNNNYATRTIISITKTKKQLEELRFEYINNKSMLMQATKQSEIAEKLAAHGIKESKVPPHKIIIEVPEKK